MKHLEIQGFVAVWEREGKEGQQNRFMAHVRNVVLGRTEEFVCYMCSFLTYVIAIKELRSRNVQKLLCIKTVRVVPLPSRLVS